MARKARATPPAPTSSTYLPGSGAYPASGLLLDTNRVSTAAWLRKAPTKLIGDEIAHQEAGVRELRKAFPHLEWATASELSEEERRADEQIAACKQLIDLLKLELVRRGLPVSKGEPTHAEIPGRAEPARGEELPKQREPRKQPSLPSQGHTIEPEVAKRRSIVRNNREENTRGLCALFDNSLVPIPPAWRSEYSVQDWEQAYLNPTLRPRIHTIVSKDRKP